jgi:hypothetical protein
VLRIKNLVKSWTASIKGASYVKFFARNIGCYNVTKAVLAIGYGIKLYVI